MSSRNHRWKMPKLGFERSNVPADAKAAVVLGVESVPDGLASGLLAGLNPVAGLYAYMYGVAAGALFTSTAFMAIQGTGAMAIIVADVDLDASDDPTRALVTLSMLTGAVMLVAGALKLGQFLRFVPHSVMAGFISAVGVNIVLGQVGDFTGYDADGGNRITRALDTIIHPWRIDLWTFLVGVLTIALIIVLRRTRLGAMGLVVAIVLGSAFASLLRGLDRDVALVGNVADVPNRLPLLTLPLLSEVVVLIVPAVSLAFVGLIQGAGVSAAFTNPDGEKGDQSRDFVAQGVGNIAAGAFRGMPVGGSMSATSLTVSAGAKSRFALLFTGVVMGLVILFFAGVVEYVAMPALAGLLILVGAETVKVDELVNVYRTGSVQAAVLAVTFTLTLLIPLQFAVLVGVGISMVLYIVRQSNQLVTQRFVEVDDGQLEEVDPPEHVPSHEVVLLQPYGSLFFAAAPLFERQLPTVTEDSVGSVVILRLKGRPDVGWTLIEVLERYAEELRGVGSRLMIVTDSDRILEQLHEIPESISDDDLYRTTNRVAETTYRALADAREWVAARELHGRPETDETPDAKGERAGGTGDEEHDG